LRFLRLEPQTRKEGHQMNCPKCGKPARKIKGAYRFRESGLGNVFLEGAETYKCPCGEEVVRIPRMAALLDKIGEAIVNKPGPLTGPEIRYLRKNAQLSSQAFAGYLQQTPETLSRWENGRRAPGRDTDLLVRLTYAALKGYGNSDRILKALTELSGRLKKKVSITLRPKGREGFEYAYT